jgi:hypothetical protein
LNRGGKGTIVKLIICLLGLTLTQAATETKTLRGWLSDEACARGRARGGVYSGTNPECAKKCVAAGKKIVFVDPNARVVLDISNQDAAQDHIGDEVAVTGLVEAGTNVLHINSLQLVARGVAMCGRPAHAKK